MRIETLSYADKRSFVFPIALCLGYNGDLAMLTLADNLRMGAFSIFRDVAVPGMDRILPRHGDPPFRRSPRNACDIIADS